MSPVLAPVAVVASRILESLQLHTDLDVIKNNYFLVYKN